MQTQQRTTPAKGFLASLFGGLFGDKQGPSLSLTRMALPKSGHGDVGRPQARAHNPLLAGVAYILRLDQWSPYFVATSGILNLQNLFTVIPGQSYTPSGGAALVINNWHTTMQPGWVAQQPRHVQHPVHVAQRPRRYVRHRPEPFPVGYVDDAFRRQRHAVRCHACLSRAGGGGGYGASSGIVSNGFPQQLNQYEMETTMVNGIPTSTAGGTGEIFPGSGLAGNLGELVTQQQHVQVTMQPTLVIDANGNATYTCSAGGTGITAFVVLRGQYSRAVQG